MPGERDYRSDELSDVAAAIDRMTVGVGAASPREGLQRPEFRRLLVAVDGSEASRHALAWGAHLAKLLNAAVTVVSVAPSPEVARALRAGTAGWQTVGAAFDEGDEHAEASLAKAKAYLQSRKIDASYELQRGRAAKCIIELSISDSSDLVILGSHGHGLGERLNLGSVGSAVKHHVPCSILVARNDPSKAPLLLATDGSQRSRLAVEVGLAWAKALGSKPVLAHAIDPGAYGMGPVFARKASQQLLADTASSSPGLAFKGAVGPGSPAAYLRKVADAQKAGLIVVGSRGLGGLRSLTLGSVSDRLSHKARQSVLVVKPRTA